MRKIIRILFLLVMVVVMFLATSVKVNAADDINPSEYQEIGTETNNENENSGNSGSGNAENNTNNVTGNETTGNAESANQNQEENNNNNIANTANSAHLQAGNFEVVKYIIVATTLAVAIAIGYVKLKKYNY